MSDDDFKVAKDYKILVLTHTFPGYYGRADTIREAKKNCLSEVGDKSKYKDLCIAFLAHKDVEVTGMGAWRRPANIPDPVRLGKV